MASLAWIRNEARVATHSLARAPLRRMRVQIDLVSGYAEAHPTDEADHLMKLAVIASDHLKRAEDAVEALHRAAGGQS